MEAGVELLQAVAHGQQGGGIGFQGQGLALQSQPALLSEGPIGRDFKPP
jgi:hypothetical protein